MRSNRFVLLPAVVTAAPARGDACHTWDRTLSRGDSGGDVRQLQDADCTPKHFSHSEFNHSCGERDHTGGNVDVATAKRNITRVMWQLKAMRHRLGDRPLVISSGFRSVACNGSVGGAEILGPGCPGHSEHTHVGTKSSQFWSGC